MLKTYSIKGNTCIVNFTVKTAVSNYAFKAEFTGGDAFGLAGKTRRATYKTKKQMEQFAIEESEMFLKGIIKLDSAVDTEAELQAKAAAAARAMKEEEAEAESENEAAEEETVKPAVKKTTKKK